MSTGGHAQPLQAVEVPLTQQVLHGLPRLAAPPQELLVAPPTRRRWPNPCPPNPARPSPPPAAAPPCGRALGGDAGHEVGHRRRAAEVAGGVGHEVRRGGVALGVAGHGQAALREGQGVADAKVRRHHEAWRTTTSTTAAIVAANARGAALLKRLRRRARRLINAEVVLDDEQAHPRPKAKSATVVPRRICLIRSTCVVVY